MIALQADELESLNKAALREILGHGSRVRPRGSQTLELTSVFTTLRNPRARLLGRSARAWSLALAVGEFFWHLAGCDEVERIAYYAPLWKTFSDDGLVVPGSCYGKHMFGGAPSQWERILGLLREDPETRRAVIYTVPANLEFGHKDVPCVTSVQFLLRREKLDAVVSMRSSDAFLGLPYDVFVFSMFQELAAAELKVEIGEFQLFAASMHMYERDREKVVRWLAEKDAQSRTMTAITSPQVLRDAAEMEARLRSGAEVSVIPPELAELIGPLKRLSDRRFGSAMPHDSPTPTVGRG